MSGSNSGHFAKTLNCDSSFEELAQAAIEAYYLIPYPGQSDVRSQSVNRRLHGGLHVSSTALNVEILIALYEKYYPKLLPPLSEQDRKLLKLAAIYHDSANTSEIHGDEKAHADRFRRDMSALGFPSNKIELFAMAIQEKDSSEKTKDIYKKILHDADCLEIIRLVGDKFDKSKLDILNTFSQGLLDSAYVTFSQQLDGIIANHKETYKLFMGDKPSEITSLHKKCEKAPNCYLALQEIEKTMFIRHIVFECLKQGEIISEAEVRAELLKKSSPWFLDLYDRKNSNLSKEIVAKLIKTPEADQAKKEMPNAELLMQNGGLFIRTLPIMAEDQLDDEFNTLERNTRALADHKITKASDLRFFIEKQSGQAKIWTPDLIWRPCTYITEGVPVLPFDLKGIAVLIDPNPQSGTMTSHYYKTNIMSRKASEGTLVYNQTKGSQKDKNDIAGIHEKTVEIDKRRSGIEPDPGLHYFGQKTVGHSEALGTYKKEGILGIVVADGVEPAKNALWLRAKLGEPWRTFYRYSPQKGLTRLSEIEIIQQSRIMEAPLSKIDNLVDVLNQDYNLNLSLGTPENITTTGQPNGTYAISQTITFNSMGIGKENSQKLANTWEEAALVIGYVRSEYGGATSIENDRSGIFKKESKKSGDLSLEIVVNADENSIHATLNDLLDMILSDTKLTLSEMDIVEGQAENPVSAELNIDDIKDIECLGDPDTLSIQTPLCFQFHHPQDDSIRCRAYVKNGIPSIELLKANGDVTQISTNLLPKIAERYYSAKALGLNKLLNENLTTTWLNENNITYLKAELEKQGPKFSLKFTIKTKEGGTQEDAQLMLQKVFPPQYLGKLKDYTQDSEGRYQFSSLNIQYLDKIHQNLVNKISPDPDPNLNARHNHL